MADVNPTRRLEILGERGLDMPLRVLDLVSQLGLCPERLAIERGADQQSIDAHLQVADREGELLVEKLRSMVLVRSATLLPIEDATSLVQALRG